MLGLEYPYLTNLYNCICRVLFSALYKYELFGLRQPYEINVIISQFGNDICPRSHCWSVVHKHGLVRLCSQSARAVTLQGLVPSPRDDPSPAAPPLPALPQHQSCLFLIHTLLRAGNASLLLPSAHTHTGQALPQASGPRPRPGLQPPSPSQGHCPRATHSPRGTICGTLLFAAAAPRMGTGTQQVLTHACRRRWEGGARRKQPKCGVTQTWPVCLTCPQTEQDPSSLTPNRCAWSHHDDEA